LNLQPLPFFAGLDEYQRQAEQLLEGHRAGDPDAIRTLKERLPRFLRSDAPWLSKNLSDAEIQKASLGMVDAQLAIARSHDFKDWCALADFVESVTQSNSPVWQFESAVEAVISGHIATLERLLSEHSSLTHARSTRVTCFDPPAHRATLLHYVAANGVEGHRQKSPANAVEIAKALLVAGAEVDALADLYGGQCTTMSLLVSSEPPARAGVQVALVDMLLDHGAAIEGHGSGQWGSPLMTALAFGYPAAAEALLRRGARVDHLAAAAGLGRVADARRLLPKADSQCRHRALALAAQLGHVEVVRLLLDAGENPNRFNPKGNHAHSTPLHQAALAGNSAVVQLLVERGARLDIKDKIYLATPRDWAEHAGHSFLAEFLRAHGRHS